MGDQGLMGMWMYSQATGMLRIYEVIVREGPVVAASIAIASTWQTLRLRTADLLARIAELEDCLRGSRR